jgi:hypothetical protein
VAAVLAIAIGISGIIATMRGAYILGGLLISLALAMAGAARLRGGDNSRPTQFIRTQAEIEAYKTLGLPIGSDKKAILKAWKTKMKAAHPDQGGTDEHAAKLNAARDLLLRLR